MDQSDRTEEGLPEALAEALRDLSEQDPAPGVDGEGFEALVGELAGPKRWSWREWPTGRRVGVVLAAAVAVVAGVWARALLGAHEVGPTPRFWTALGLSALWVGLGVAASLRPLYKPPLHPGARWGVLGLLVLTPLALALWPPEVGYTLYDPQSWLRGMIGPEWTCLVSGGLSALPVGVVWALLQRSDRPAIWPVILAAGAAGLTGFVSLDFHCEITTRDHLLLSHFGAVITVLAVALMAFVWARGRRP